MQNSDDDRSLPMESIALYDPIAIVGFAMKFPGEADSVEGFWEMLTEGRCAATPFPQDRLCVSGLYHPDAARHDTAGLPINLKGGHFLHQDVAAFDAPFFSISATEAASMDPQQRLLLETTYRALENSGIPIMKVANSRTCVFTGSFIDDYKTLYTKDIDHAAKYAAIGVPTSCSSSRISWFFNLRGNSVTIDTACSSSLVALDLACKSIHSGESKMGIVTGANLLLAADFFLILADMGMLSPDSRCWSFNELANGYGRGEGVGALIIKKVSDAVKDGDTIRAVIRSSSSNSDGYTPGITQPSQRSQEELIQYCYQNAGLDLNRTGYVEAHGTGTPVGDPIEANALGAVFRKGRDVAQSLHVGSVKSNIGHLEGSSGVAGVIKAILMLERGVIPQVADLHQLNPRIDEKWLKLKFPKETKPWPSPGLRRASVNSFGYGGTNSHAVLDDALHFLQEHGLVGNHCTTSEPPGQNVFSFASVATCSPSNPVRRPLIGSSLKALIFSAADKEALTRMSHDYANHLGQVQSRLSSHDLRSYLENLAYTLALRRSSLPWKAYAVVDAGKFDSNSLIEAMSQPVRADTKPKIALIFTGQGAQWATMGKDLLKYEAFKSSLQETEATLQSFGCPWKLTDELMRPQCSTKINNASFSQPICTALQIALVDLLRACGVFPNAVIGHSSGEIAAAYCIGAINQQAALKIAYMRGMSTSTLQQTSSIKGAMMSVGLAAEQIQPYLADATLCGRLVIACHNSPRNVTVSGDEVSVEQLKSILENDQVFVRRLAVDMAYHSPQMQGIAELYADSLADLDFGLVAQNGSIMISSVTGSKTAIDDLRDPSYWVKNLISPVLFTTAFERIDDENTTKKLDLSHLEFFKVDVCVEVGPHAALRGPVRDNLTRNGRNKAVRYASLLERNENGLTTFLKTLGFLHCCGYPVEWSYANHSGIARTSLVSLCDLPEYPFDHSTTYWHESRIAKATRLRSEPKLDLLGKTVPDWNPFEARWRHFLRASELPWIDDHKVNGVTLFPAAGMMTMAIEALNQLSDQEKSYRGFELRDVNFHTALVVPSDGVQVELHINQSQEASRSDMKWRLFALVNGQWTECCNGSARTDHMEEASEVSDGMEDEKLAERHRLEYKQSRQQCTGQVRPSQLYKQLGKCGFGFGPAFQSIRDGYFSATTVTAQIACYQWISSGNTNPRQDHLVHPCTLDGLLQPALVALTRGGTRTTNSAVPTSIRRVWISKAGFAWPQCTSVDAVARFTNVGNRGFEMRCSGMTQDSTQLSAILEGVRFTYLSNTVESQSELTLWSLDWKPDVDLLTSPALKDYCNVGAAQTSEPVEFHEKISFLLYTFLDTTIRQLSSINVSKMPSHFQNYLSWAHWQKERCFATKAPGTDSTFGRMVLDQVYVNRIKDELDNEDAIVKVLKLVGQNLLEILHGKIDVLELLYHSNLIHDYYEKASIQSRAFGIFDQYLSAYSHKHPDARYLEVGAGTGGSTFAILQSLLHHQDPRYGAHLYQNYTFSDISESFFERAKEKFVDYPNIDYKLFDIEHPFEPQGFEEKSFDCIIAANVIHATHSLANTLKNLHRLLRPGGRLVLFELTNPANLQSGFWTGLLPGWWLSSEDFRAQGHSPCASSDEWHRLLVENGFSGIDMLLRDYESDICHTVSIMVSSVPTASPSKQDLKVTVTTTTAGSDPIGVDQLKSAFFKEGVDCSIVTSGSGFSVDATGDICIVQELPGQALLRSWTNKDLTDLRQLLSSYSTIIWITLKADTCLHPDEGMIDGLARVIRNEYQHLKFVTIALTSTRLSASKYVQIAAIAVQSHYSNIDTCETAFEERDGLLHLWRFNNSTKVSQAVSKLKRQEVKCDMPWSDSPALKMAMETPGLIDTLHFAEDKDHSKMLDAHEVEIKVHAVGLNFKDCLIALNQVDGFGFGIECAGVITRAGSLCCLPIGTRVCMMTTNTFMTFARGHYECVVELPEQMSFVEGAAIPLQFFTAWACLVELAHLEKNESVLIHAGAGGTGQAAIQIAKHIGAEIFVTVSSQAKKSLLMDEYGLKEDHILYSRDTSFAKAIRRITLDRGVDVILNSLAGESLLRSWDCLAPYGRFLEIGKLDIQQNGSLPMLPFNRCRSFIAFDGTAWIEERPNIAGRIMSTVVDMFTRGILRTARPLHVHDISEVSSVFRRFADGKSSGKSVFQISPATIVPTVLKRRMTYKFETDKTYVISGGLGGVGRRIARWMVSCGARYLLLLSRTGVRDASAEGFIAEIEAEGVRVQAPPCDISDRHTLATTLEQCIHVMPPIKGCVQASMVLRDALLKDMTIEQWETATKPKVQGSWNLHELLPRNLDFFVCLSSMSGIHGLQGQANYAAGNTYLDALAHYRVSQGEKAISINLGVILTEGYIAGHQIVVDRLLNIGVFEVVPMAEFDAMMEYYCDPALPVLPSAEAQVIIGITTPQNVRSQGRDTPELMRQPIYRVMHRIPGADWEVRGSSDGPAMDFRRDFMRAETDTDASNVAMHALVAKLRRVISSLAKDENVDIHKPVYSFGVDSLLAVELRNWFSREFQAEVAVFEITGGSSCAAIGQLVANKSLLRQTEKKSYTDYS